jgi:HK97 family phage portal protein
VNIFGLNITLSRGAAETKDADSIPLNTLLTRLDELHRTASKVTVTPETAMQSPTVHAIVTGLSRRIATLPVRVQQETMRSGRKVNEDLPGHWVNRVLTRPNDWQDRVTFWLDAASWLIRYGNCYWVKAQGNTGPVRRLVPIPAGDMTIEQDLDTLDLVYRGQIGASRQQMTWTPRQVVHARTAARDGIVGNSPISDIKEAIALEIAAEHMGSEVFGNLAMPGLLFEYAPGTQGHKTDEERQRFIDEFRARYTGGGRWSPGFLPKGVQVASTPTIDNDKAQYLQLRQYQRSVIAGAFGVPLHLVGDLSKGTFNNVHEQNRDVIMNVVMAYIQVFEAALERSLLTDADRNNGVIIRFNLDAALRADFKTRQEGLNLQRQAGVINVNEWREREGYNPIPEGDGGEEYWRQGPSGQSADAPGTDGPEVDEDGDPDAEAEEAAKVRDAELIKRRAAYQVAGNRASLALTAMGEKLGRNMEEAA